MGFDRKNLEVFLPRIFGSGGRENFVANVVAGNAAVTTLNGRALGLNASVTVVNTVVNVPAP